MNIKLKPIDLQNQIEIVEKLVKIQEIIDLRKKQISQMDELIQAKFVEMFGLPEQKKYPEKTLVEIAKNSKYSIKRGPFGGSLKKEEFVEKGYLVYEQKHVIQNDFQYEKYYISEKKYKEMEMFKVEPGDLLISCSGTLGKIAEVPENAKEGIINQALLKVSLNPQIMNNIYFITLFRNEQIQNLLFGCSRGSGISNFPSMTEIKKLKFLCPPIEKQKQFQYMVGNIEKSEESLKNNLKEMEKIQESLMSQYFEE